MPGHVGASLRVDRDVPVKVRDEPPTKVEYRSRDPVAFSLAMNKSSGLELLPLRVRSKAPGVAGSLALLARMRAVPPPPDAERPSLRGVVEGIRYAGSRPELLGTYGVDMIAMFFGMPMALFPAFADELGGAGVLGLLYAAPEVGSLLVTATSGWTSRIHRHGAAVLWAAAGWGVAIVGFGFAPNLALALLALAVAGAADMVSGIFRTTIWNQTIPDRLRGRLAGIEQVSYSSGPLLGNLESGVVAAFAGLRASVVSGGILCVVGVAVAAVALPAFRRYDAREFEASRAAAEPALTRLE